MLSDDEIVKINERYYNIAFRSFDADVSIARTIEAAATEPLLKRIAELEQERDQWKEDALHGGNAAYLRDQLDAVRKDAERWKKFRAAWVDAGSSKYDAMLGALAIADSDPEIDVAIDAAKERT